MPTDHRATLATIRRFDQLIAYLRDEMGWPITQNSFDDVDDLFFEFTPEELGIDPKNASKIQEIRRLRPLSTSQPWGIFFIKFEPGRLQVAALRRILSSVTLKKRASANSADRTAWAADDLLFISNYGDGNARQISFAHFSQHEGKKDLPTLKVLGWDDLDTPLHLDDIADRLTTQLAWPDDEGDTSEWRKQWRSAFTLGHRETITTSKNLAVALASLARKIRARINTVLAIETDDGPVSSLMEVFREALVQDLDADGFADMYAQTIAYGLLSARVTNPSGGTADDLAQAMPVTNPFLKELMESFLAVGGRKGTVGIGHSLDFDELGVGEITELLNAANMEAVVRDFGDKNPQEDPVIHFFEGFLQEYDRQIRKERGVFYTPRPVVSFIVRSVDESLRTEFGLEDGLADNTTWGEMADRIDDQEIPEGATPDQAFVQILDPATGTGTFLVEVIDLIHKTMTAKWQAEGHGKKKIEKLWNDYVPEHLLPRVHGYELMMAPYAIAHMKIGLKLYETGYRFESKERARIYLTNALEPAQDFSGRLAFAIPALAHEAEAVNEIKKNQRFTVVIGNPPYSVSSQNRGGWIEELCEDFKKGLSDERNIQPLADDYIKFLRFALLLVDVSATGIIGMITNREYLQGVIHRSLRKRLIDTASDFRVVDLHGQVGQLLEAGEKDENVFEISKGVSIAIASFGLANAPKVSYGEIVAPAADKLEKLNSSVASLIANTALRPVDPYWFLAPFDDSYEEEYGQYPSIKEFFPKEPVTGFATHRDHFAIAMDKSALEQRMSYFLSPDVSTDEIREQFSLKDTRDWSLVDAHEGASKEPRFLEQISPCLYRPFDIRWVIYSDHILEYSRRATMQHISRQCLGLICSRIVKNEEYAHVFVTAHPVEKIFLSPKSSNNAQLFLTGTRNPQGGLFNDPEQSGGFHMLSHLSGDDSLGQSEELGYIYAILHSPGFRHRYAEYLKFDFPRIPIISSSSLIRSLADLGTDLISLHLLDCPIVEDHITEPVGSGVFQVETVGYADGLIWIDRARTHGFRGVPEDVWNFHIGGYQVCEKWLKDRQAKGGKNPRPGRVLTDEDINHYQKIIVALSETIRIMGEIDEVIEAHGGWPEAFQTSEGER